MRDYTFIKYSVVGVVNTLVHWLIFMMLHIYFLLSQSISNMIAFICAATFSYAINAYYTFETKIRFTRYFLFLLIMLLLSWSTGYIADSIQLSPIITLILFSAISWIFGFLFSKYLIFTSGEQ